MIELLFDYVTFRKLLKGGDDLVGFGKVMAAYQRTELDKLKAIIREFCVDLNAILSCMNGVAPFIDRAEAMFQVHTKDGNPLASEDRWNKFRSVIETGRVDAESLKSISLAANEKAREDLIVGLTA